MASVTHSALRRALLYVPASSQKMLKKSLTFSLTDNVTYDLEDSVTAQNKHSARVALKEHLIEHPSRPPAVSELAVRINSVSTPHALQDLTVLASLPNVDAIVVPKVNSASDLTFVTDVLRHVAPKRHSSVPKEEGGPGPIKLIALIESARAVMDLKDICSASPYLDGLIFAAEDFALDMNLTRTPSLSEFAYARSAVATAARAFGLASTIDLVCTAYKGQEGIARLAEECRNGRQLGFNGKQCIHPNQVKVAQAMFAPSEDEVNWAVRVVVADEKAEAAGRGAWTLDGKMIDAPVSGKARAVVEKAKRCGFDIDSLREKWQDEEPE